jgi:serine/threonine protein kinase
MSYPKKIGQFHILNVIGQGSSGIVFQASDGFSSSLVAIKLLRPEYADDPILLNRFYQEAHILAAVSHPNVVKILDTGSWEGRPFFVMEYLDGQSLEAQLRNGTMTETEAVRIISPLLEGLNAVHAVGVVHRDFKPSNIFLTTEGRVVLTDFSISLAVERARMTKVGFVGSPAYMAPEQFGGLDVTARSDLYAVGTVLYEMLSGAPPFSYSDPSNFARAHRSVNPPELTGRSPIIQEVIRKSLQKKPGDRFASATEMRNALMPILSPKVIATPKPESQSRQHTRDSRQSTARGISGKSETNFSSRMIIAVCGIVTSLFLIAYFAFGAPSSRRQPDSLYTEVASPNNVEVVESPTTPPSTQAWGLAYIPGHPVSEKFKYFAEVTSGGKVEQYSGKFQEDFLVQGRLGKWERKMSELLRGPDGSSVKSTSMNYQRPADQAGRPSEGSWLSPWSYLSYWPPAEPISVGDEWGFDQSDDPTLKRPSVNFNFRLLGLEKHGAAGLLKVSFYLNEGGKPITGSGYFLLNQQNFKEVFGCLTLREGSGKSIVTTYIQESEDGWSDPVVRTLTIIPPTPTIGHVNTIEPAQPPMTAAQLRSKYADLKNQINEVKDKLSRTSPGREERNVDHLMARLNNLLQLREEIGRRIQKLEQ